MSDHDVVKAYKTEFEANLARTTLRRAGIRSRVHRFSRYRALAGGGYLVQADPADVPKARALLDSLETVIDMDEYIDEDDATCQRCPACRSANVEARPLSGRQSVLVAATLGVALFFLYRDWRCTKCGHRWRM